MTSAGPERLLTEVRWNWDWSPAATAVILAGAAAWVIAVYVNEQRFVSRRKRAALAALRIVAVAIALAMLAHPTIERRRVAPPRLVVLVDDSASMDTRDVAAADLAGADGATGQVTRREAWESLLTGGEQALLDDLRSRFEVTTASFAKEAKLLDEAPAASKSDAVEAVAADREATALGDAIDFAVRQMPGARPAAVVALTDGINTAGRPLAETVARARTLGVPVYTVALGSDRPRSDVAIEDVVVEEVVFPGDRLQVEAAVRSVGYTGRETQVVLKRADDDTVLAKTQVELPADGEAQTVRLALRPTEPGRLRLAIEVDVQSDEDNVANNRSELTVDVREAPIRVLLVDSRPTYEYRALKSLLERDPAITLRVWLQDADPDYASVDEAALRSFPATEADLLEYDVVLLGDVDPSVLPRQTWDLLEKFVSAHGGGLAVIAGQQFMPRAFADIAAMRTLLPIDLGLGVASQTTANAIDGVKVTPTPLGMQEASLQLGETVDESAAIWGELPPVLWVLEPVRPKPGAQVLAVARVADGDASADSPPVILRQYVGAGEVLMHATDETWRWRWRNDDRYFARYWGQAMRRLARGRALRGVGSLSTSRTEYGVGEPVTIRLRQGAAAQAGEAVTIELSGESTPTREIQLSRRGAFGHAFETTLRDLPADRYIVRSMAAAGRAAPLRTEFTVAAPPGELAQLVVNSAGLREAAEATGGKFYTAKTAGRLRDELPRAEPVAIERLPEEPLWNSAWFLIALCSVLGVEWLVRRRSGML